MTSESEKNRVPKDEPLQKLKGFESTRTQPKETKNNHETRFSKAIEPNDKLLENKKLYSNVCWIKRAVRQMQKAGQMMEQVMKHLKKCSSGTNKQNRILQGNLLQD